VAKKVNSKESFGKEAIDVGVQKGETKRFNHCLRKWKLHKNALELGGAGWCTAPRRINFWGLNLSSHRNMRGRTPILVNNQGSVTSEK